MVRGSKRILVTGAGGFAGRHIAEYLHAKGYDIVGTVYRHVPNVSFPTISCDLSQPIELNQEFDVIVHAAGSLPYRTPDFMEYKRNNIDTTQNLLNFALRKNISRVVFLSTIGIYGEFCDTIIDENSDRINPDAYGLTKYIAECMLRSVPEIKSISLRMPGIIGPGCKGVWLSNVIEKFQRNEEVTIYSPEFTTRNFVWVEDLARFVDRLILMDYWKYDVLLLSSDETISIRKIVNAAREMYASSSEIIVRKTDKQPFCLSNARAKEMEYEGISPIKMIEIMSKKVIV